ncbi:DUF4369 domain-containing protein [Aureivirga sp. CE67]|uniref:DUF4369 domain-containing protein n=1 Tax=Aureivirga sp. CE67 TaxID=1788983 RepID=UPI0018CB6343|nr:DUF4369 domain-containing protein [Aureivirga sp. CE67]
MKKLILFVLVSIVIISCTETQNHRKNKGFKIEAKVSGLKDSTLMYLKDINHATTIDSAYVIDEKFSFSGKFDSEPKFLNISTNFNLDFDKINKDTRTTDLAISKAILIGNEHIIIDATKENFDMTINAKGSKYNDSYNKKIKSIGKLNNERSALFWKYQLMSGGFIEYSDSLKSFITNRMDAIKEEVQDKRMQFIKENTDNYTGMIELSYLIQNFQQEKAKELFDQFPKEIQESDFAEKVRTYIGIKPTYDNSFSDFTAQDQFGNTIQFYDLEKKNIHLLIFQL